VTHRIKSKCQKQLDTMTEERDHWKKKAQEHKRKIERLEMQFSNLNLGAINTDKQIEAVQIERDNAIEAFTELQGLMAEYKQRDKSKHITAHRHKVIDDMLTPFMQPIPDGTVRTKTALFYMDANRHKLHILGVDYIDIQMQFDDFEQRIPLLHAHNFLRSAGIPTIGDFSGNFLENWVDPYCQLTNAYFIQNFMSLKQLSGEDYQQYRIRWRDDLWEHIKHGESEKYTHTKDSFRIAFNAFVTRSLERIEKQNTNITTQFLTDTKNVSDKSQ
jgi:hypothetical protein